MNDTPEQKPTPETDALRDEIWDTPYRDGDDFSKMLDHAKKLESERDEARCRFNEIDLCKNGQAPCKWSLKLIHERDTAIAERDVLFQAIRNLRDTKGRYHTQQAFESLMTLLPTNQND